jgi:phage/plasmid primase-like uncharacterized protein
VAEILPQLGIGTEFLTNRHGPCPLCGGKDRYRFDDKHGEGTYYCNRCGAGNGLVLIRKKHGWDFKTACSVIDRVLGDIGYRPAAASGKAPPQGCDTTLAERAIQRALGGATAPEVVTEYCAPAPRPLNRIQRAPGAPWPRLL